MFNCLNYLIQEAVPEALQPKLGTGTIVLLVVYI